MITPAFRILRYRDIECILCLVCNRISFHSEDVRRRFCGACNLFLADLPMDYEGDPLQTEGRAPGLPLEGRDVTDKTPHCPDCGNILHAVTYPSGSYLNRDQWESQRAGDWYCNCCTSNVARTGFRYFWNSELRKDPEP